MHCVLGFHTVRAHPGRGWPCHGLAERQESVTAIVSSSDLLLCLKWMILMATHDVRAWLYVKLTSYPLSHDSRGTIGCVGHSETGPLDFTRGGVAVTELYLH